MITGNGKDLEGLKQLESIYLVNGTWLPVADSYFHKFFESGEGFQLDRLEEALTYVPKKRFKIAVDAGAHVGDWSRLLAKHFKEVHSFEPALDTCECLKRNVKNWANVKVFKEAVGDKLRVVTSTDDSTRVGNTGARYVSINNDNIISTNSVQMVALDYIGLKRLDFLKLDIEGAEILALKGAKNLLLEWKPVVYIESKKGMAERFGYKDGEAISYLEKLGAKLVKRIKSDYIFTFE